MLAFIPSLLAAFSLTHLWRGRITAVAEHSLHDVVLYPTHDGFPTGNAAGNDAAFSGKFLALLEFAVQQNPRPRKRPQAWDINYWCGACGDSATRLSDAPAATTPDSNRDAVARHRFRLCPGFFHACINS